MRWFLACFLAICFAILPCRGDVSVEGTVTKLGADFISMETYAKERVTFMVCPNFLDNGPEPNRAFRNWFHDIDVGMEVELIIRGPYLGPRFCVGIHIIQKKEP